MATQQYELTADIEVDSAPSVAKPNPTMWPFILGILVVGGFFAYFARTGAVSPRVANPEVTGAPRPVEFLFGIPDTTWLFWLQVGTIIAMTLLVAVCVFVWRRQPGHPYVLMTMASTLIVWQDPIMNWAPYAVYNPLLWHLPEDWFLVKLSPTVEPFVVLGYAMFYFGPFFPAIWVLRRLQARASSREAFVWRHPLVSLAALALGIGIVFDAALEITLVRTGLYIYSQVIPWASIFAGTTFQFPLMFEVLAVCWVMVPAAVLCYRDDTGRTVAEKLCQRFRFMLKYPTAGTFVMMAIIINLAYFCYGGTFALVRASGLATAVACPYPYPDAKTYDPQGYWEREGAPGPYLEGYWNTWMTAQPDGRPKNNPVKPDAMCKGSRGSELSLLTAQPEVNPIKPKGTCR